MKQLILTSLAALLLTAAPLPSFAQAPPRAGEDTAQIQATGRVQNVSNRDFTLEVRGMTFRVTYDLPQITGRLDFRAGDRVRVEGELVNTDRIRASQVRLVDRARDERDPLDRRTGNVEGTIRRIDRENRTMTVQTDEGNYTVKWEEGASFYRDNERSAPRDFRSGDRVRVTGRRLEGREIQARRIFMGGRAGWTNNAIGEVTGINSRNNELQVDFGGEIWTVRFRPNDLRDNGRALDLNRLRVGQDVRVSGASRTGRVVDATGVELLR